MQKINMGVESSYKPVSTNVRLVVFRQKYSVIKLVHVKMDIRYDELES